MNSASSLPLEIQEYIDKYSVRGNWKISRQLANELGVSQSLVLSYRTMNNYIPWKICPTCKTEFQVKYSGEKYCSHECFRNAYPFRERKILPLVTKICPICKSTFETTDIDKKFCSSDCANESLRTISRNILAMFIVRLQEMDKATYYKVLESLRIDYCGPNYHSTKEWKQFNHNLWVRLQYFKKESKRRQIKTKPKRRNLDDDSTFIRTIFPEWTSSKATLL